MWPGADRGPAAAHGAISRGYGETTCPVSSSLSGQAWQRSLWAGAGHLSAGAGEPPPPGHPPQSFRRLWPAQLLPLHRASPRPGLPVPWGQRSPAAPRTSRPRLAADEGTAPSAPTALTSRGLQTSSSAPAPWTLNCQALVPHVQVALGAGTRESGKATRLLLGEQRVPRWSRAASQAGKGALAGRQGGHSGTAWKLQEDRQEAWARPG